MDESLPVGEVRLPTLSEVTMSCPPRNNARVEPVLAGAKPGTDARWIRAAHRAPPQCTEVERHGSR